MLQSLTPTLVLSAKKSTTIATAEEFARARTAQKRQEPAPMIPVRLTLDSDGKFVRMVRTDKAITPLTVGREPVRRGQNTTIDALMLPSVAGSFGLAAGRVTEDCVTFLTLPFVTPEGGWAGYVNADFRLRSIYLPCREKQPSKAYQSMMSGQAWIDVEKQTVVRLDVIDPLQAKAPVGTLLHNIPATDSAPYMVVVTCYLANGGCCFERAIR